MKYEKKNADLIYHVRNHLVTLCSPLEIATTVGIKQNCRVFFSAARCRIRGRQVS